MPEFYKTTLANINTYLLHRKPGTQPGRVFRAITAAAFLFFVPYLKVDAQTSASPIASTFGAAPSGLPSGASVGAFSGTINSGPVTFTVTKPTTGCYAYGFQYLATGAPGNSGWGITGTCPNTTSTFYGTVSNTARWTYVAGANTDSLQFTSTIVNPSGCSMTTSFPSPIKMSVKIVSPTSGASSRWIVNTSTGYAYVPMTSSNVTLRVILKTNNGNYINAYTWNPCSGISTCFSINWGWFLVTMPTTVSIAETSGVGNNDGITCSGASVTLTAPGTPSGGTYGNSTGAYTWSWTGGGGGSGQALTPSPLPTNVSSNGSAATNTYTVTVTDAAMGCSTSLPTTITTYANPVINPVQTTGPICSSSSVTLTGNPSSGSLSYSTQLWSVASQMGTGTPAITNSGTANASVAANTMNNGTITFQYQVTDSRGCSVGPSSATPAPLTVYKITGSASKTDAAICGGAGSITVSGLTGGETNNWAYRIYNVNTASNYLTGTFNTANPATFTGVPQATYRVFVRNATFSPSCEVQIGSDLVVGQSVTAPNAPAAQPTGALANASIGTATNTIIPNGSITASTGTAANVRIYNTVAWLPTGGASDNVIFDLGSEKSIMAIVTQGNPVTTTQYVKTYTVEYSTSGTGGPWTVAPVGTSGVVTESRTNGATAIQTNFTSNVLARYWRITVANNAAHYNVARALRLELLAVPCAGSPIYFEAPPALANATGYRWYTASTGGTLLSDNTLGFNTSTPTADGTYYVSSWHSTAQCESGRTAVNFYVNPIPGVPNVNGSTTTITINICGTGTITAAPGTNGTTCRWYSSTTFTPANLLATGTSYSPPASGHVYVTTYNANTGCESTSYVDVTVIKTPSFTISQSQTNTSCNINTTTGTLASNGSAKVTITSGGTAPFTYNWDVVGTVTNTTSPTISSTNSGLAAGTYNVSISDAGSCFNLATFTITEPSAVTFSETYSNYNGYNVGCYGGNNGSITLNSSGGTPGSPTTYTYTWSAGTPSTANNGNTGISSNLSSGPTYTVTVRDGNNCPATGSFTLTQPNDLTGAITASYQCASGGVYTSVILTANPSGGVSPYTYSWTGGSTSQTPSFPKAGNDGTTKTVVITDANGCTQSVNFTIDFPDDGTTSNDCDIVYATPGGDASATALGTRECPASFLRALLIAGSTSRKTIKMEGAAFTITSGTISGTSGASNPINIPTGVTIDGGYFIDNTTSPHTWKKMDNLVTTLNMDVPLYTYTYSSGTYSGTSVGCYIGLQANGISNFTIKDVTINVKNGGSSGTATGVTSSRGNTVYGMHINGSTNFNLIRCTINPGQGSAGSDGVAGTPNLITSYTNGGAGGAHGTDDKCASNGSAGSGAGGGYAGSRGCPACYYEIFGIGICACTIWPLDWSCCGYWGVWYNSPAYYGGNGTNGGPGSQGSDGATVSPSRAPTTAPVSGMTFYVPQTQAVSGNNGGGGYGGGGGGGGALGSCGCSSCGSGDSYGGAGGRGGRGGGGGTGGYGGGGSFGVYIVGNSSGSIINYSIGAGTAGIGGTGGAGANGETGSALQGETGHLHSREGAGRGGNGGNGGRGGNGSKGQDGANGATGSIINLATTPGNISTTTASIPTAPTVTVNMFKGCSNSVIELSKSASPAGNWVTTGASPVDDISPGNRSTSTSTSTYNIYYPNGATLGFYDVGAGGNTFSKFIHLTNNSRSLPDISVNGTVTTSVTLCPGTVTLASSLTGDAYFWEVQQVSTPNSLAAPGSNLLSSGAQVIQNTSVTLNTPGTYQVSLQIKDYCCGWSIPKYATIIIQAVPTAPAGLTGAGSVCAGSQSAYSVTNVVGYTYDWSLPSGATIVSTPTNSNSVTIQFGITPQTNAQISVTASNSCTPPQTSPQSTILVNINSTPVATIAPFTGYNTTICDNTATQLQASITGGNGSNTLTWSSSPPGKISGSTSANPVVTTQLTDNTNFTLIARDGNNCADTIMQTVTVLDPFASGAIDNTGKTICYNTAPTGTGIPISVSTAASGGNNTFTYKWYQNTNPAATCPAAGTAAASLAAAGWTTVTGGSGGTTNAYTPPVLTTTTTYLLTVDATGAAGPPVIPDCGGEITSDRCYKVTVLPTFGAGTITSTPEVLDCALSVDPSSISSTTPDVQGAIGYSYKWYYKDGENTCPTGAYTGTEGFTLISGANSASYDPPSGLTVVRTYARTVDASGTPDCGSETWSSGCRVVYPGGGNLINVLSTYTTYKECLVNDNQWHYFRNANGQLIAAINSFGEDLGIVRIDVNVDALYYTHGNGGFGHNGDCQGTAEYSMGRYYKLTTAKIPTSGTTHVRFYYNNVDYDAYEDAIIDYVTGPPAHPNYGMCYGYPQGRGTLAIIRDETTDLTNAVNTFPGGATYIGWTEVLLPPSLLRIRDIGAGNTTLAEHRYRWHTNGGIGEPLPVELIAFIGWNEGSVNKLQWVTASEQNSLKYIVERSLDGTNNWSFMGELPAAGNSNSLLTYNFSDFSPAFGNNYYRLMLVDKDGRFEYSNVINIPVNTITQNAILGIYPNPTSGLLNIDLQVTDNYNTEMKVYDVLGQVVATKQVALNKGLNKLQMNYSGLANASYILSFTDKSGNQHQVKFIKH